MKRKVLLADPSLYGMTGHCLNYLLSVAEQLESHGFDIHIAGHKHMNITTPYTTHSIFSYMVDGLVGQDVFHHRNYIRKMHEDALDKELTILSHKLSLSSQDIVLVNTVRQWPLRGIVRWLRRLNVNYRPSVVVILHFTAYPKPYGNPLWVADMYNDALSVAAKEALPQLRFFADTSELSQEYNAYNQVNVETICIPHVIPANRSDSDEHETVHIGYLGEPRKNKGFHVLPEIMKFTSSLIREKKVKFHIQTASSNPEDEYYKINMARIRPYCPTLYESPLNPRQYQELIMRNDIILLPYEIENYHSQSSGIFAEAAGMGKIILTSMGTWAGRQSSAYNLGLTAPPDDGLFYSDNLRKIITEIQQFRKNSINGALNWTNNHGAQQFVKTILS